MAVGANTPHISSAYAASGSAEISSWATFQTLATVCS